jgi:hypothetical protein
MGLALTIHETNGSVLDEPAQNSTPRRRHRRPTLLARSGHAVAGRITALAGADLEGSHQAVGAHALRRKALPARRYWT